MLLHEARKARLGWHIWKSMLKKLNIDYSTAVLVLPEDNQAWNECALRYFPAYVERKSARRALVIVRDKEQADFVRNRVAGCDYEIYCLSRIKMELLLKYYCLNKFFDNIVMMFLEEPYDNDTMRILEIGAASMEEMVCLCFYQLRGVPADA